jgi:ABC-2 type transport system ATP-binding protein
MIEVANLTKRFGTTVAVDDLSFTVQPGRVTGFLGPNGAGKSTTMRVILGLDAPTGGNAQVAGQTVRGHHAPLTLIGALLDARALHPQRTAFDHLRALAVTNGLSTRRVDEVLAVVGLAEVARRRGGGLSMGMGQRLGIAAALLGDPQVIMLDEPVNGLDPEGIVWIRRLLSDLARQGRTVFVSSHLMSEMELMADHYVIVGRGRLLADVPAADLSAMAGSGHVAVGADDPVRLTELIARAGGHVTVLADELAVTGLDAAFIGRLARDHGIALTALTPRTATLEQVFVELTAGAVEYHGTLVDQ